MAKTLNELAGDLKTLIIDLQSDAHNRTNINLSRYNNLKLKMDPSKNSTPHVVISLAMSEAIFNITSGEKITGSLGPDERYAIRWFGKGSTLESLKECWNNAVKSNTQASDDEE